MTENSCSALRAVTARLKDDWCWLPGAIEVEEGAGLFLGGIDA